MKEYVGRGWNDWLLSRNQIANTVAAQSACNNEVGDPRSDFSKPVSPLVNQWISPHCTSPVHTV